MSFYMSGWYRLKSLLCSMIILAHLMAAGLVLGAQTESVVVCDPSQPHQDMADAKLAETFTLSFRHQFGRVIENAEHYLVSRKKVASRNRNSKLQDAVVLDLDETLMDNRAYFMRFKKYDPQLWEAWVSQMEAPAIPETQAFVKWLNKQRFKVYFISGRRELGRAQTEDNLKKMGVTEYAGLYLRPNDDVAVSPSEFKRQSREAIEKKGHKIILNLGDQVSDCVGGFGECFKLPNPIYTIP